MTLSVCVCVCGQVLGLPGGDLAEFINALDAYEEMTNSYVRDSGLSLYICIFFWWGGGLSCISVCVFGFFIII